MVTGIEQGRTMVDTVMADLRTGSVTPRVRGGGAGYVGRARGRDI
jgi:hypothetical protein